MFTSPFVVNNASHIFSMHCTNIIPRSKSRLLVYIYWDSSSKKNTPQRKLPPHNRKTHIHREKKRSRTFLCLNFYNCLDTFVPAVFHFSTMNKVYSVPLLMSSLRRRKYCHFLVRSWNCMVSPPPLAEKCQGFVFVFSEFVQVKHSVYMCACVRSCVHGEACACVRACTGARECVRARLL